MKSVVNLWNLILHLTDFDVCWLVMHNNKVFWVSDSVIDWLIGSASFICLNNSLVYPLTIGNRLQEGTHWGLLSCRPPAMVCLILLDVAVRKMQFEKCSVQPTTSIGLCVKNRKHSNDKVMTWAHREGKGVCILWSFPGVGSSRTTSDQGGGEGERTPMGN